MNRSEKCQFRRDIGDINGDGVDEAVCLAKSQITTWDKLDLLPCGEIYFCDNCLDMGK